MLIDYQGITLSSSTSTILRVWFGFELTWLPSWREATRQTLAALYDPDAIPRTPISYKHISLDARNGQIIALYNEGLTLEALAARFEISIARVHQIVRRWSDG